MADIVFSAFHAVIVFTANDHFFIHSASDLITVFHSEGDLYIIGFLEITHSNSSFVSLTPADEASVTPHTEEGAQINSDSCPNADATSNEASNSDNDGNANNNAGEATDITIDNNVNIEVVTDNIIADDLASLLDNSDDERTPTHAATVQTRNQKEQQRKKLQQEEEERQKLINNNGYFNIPLGERCSSHHNFVQEITRIGRNILRRHDRTHKPVACNECDRLICEDSAHLRGSCENCIRARRGSRYHYSASTPAFHNYNSELHPEDTVAVDIICRGMNDYAILGCTKSGFCCVHPIDDRSLQSVTRGLFGILKELRHYYKVVPWRIHSDKEPSLVSLAGEDKNFLPFLFTYSLSGDSMANGLAERHVGLVADHARRNLSHLRCAKTRASMWRHSVRHASFARSLARAFEVQKEHGLEVPVLPCVGESIVPFLSLGCAHEYSEDPSKEQDKNNMCLYLYPSPDNTEATTVIFIIDKGGDKVIPRQTNGRKSIVTDVRGFTPYINNMQQQHVKLPQLECITSHAETTETLHCPVCGLPREMTMKTFNEINQEFNQFSCEVIKDKCGVPSTGLAGIRQGKPKKENLKIQVANRITHECRKITNSDAGQCGILSSTSTTQPKDADAEAWNIDQLLKCGLIDRQPQKEFGALPGAEQTAAVTKLLKRSDHRHEQAQAAMRKECDQLFDIDKIILAPIERANAPEGATLCDTMMLVSIKNFEFANSLEEMIKEGKDSIAQILSGASEQHAPSDRPSLSGLKANHGFVADVLELEERQHRLEQLLKLRQELEDDGVEALFESECKADEEDFVGASEKTVKWKGRLVARGDCIEDAISGEIIYGRGATITTQVWAATTSLDGFRSVIALAARRQQKIFSLDLPSAFVQCDAPKEHPHFLTFSEQVREFMRPDLRGSSLRQPIYQMVRMLYGLPQSGFVFCEKLRACLLDQGFLATTWDRGVLFNQKLNCYVACYIDDVLFTLPAENVEQFLEIVRRDFNVPDCHECKKYLGVTVHIDHSDPSLTAVRLNQSEYCQVIVDTFQELFNVKNFHPRPFPGVWEESQFTTNLHNGGTTALPLRHIRAVQKCLGKILWLQRCTRVDLTSYVTYLASRIQRWGAEDQKRLQHLVEYIAYTKEKSLYWSFDHADTEVDVDLNFDANWKAPRSCASWCLLITGNRTRALISWGAKRIRCAANSSTMSELSAAMMAVSACNSQAFWLSQSMNSSVHDASSGGYRLVGDNLASLKIIVKGYSSLSKLYLEQSLNRPVSIRIALLSELVRERIASPLHIRSRFNASDLGSKTSHSRYDCSYLSDLNGVLWSFREWALLNDHQLTVPLPVYNALDKIVKETSKSNSTRVQLGQKVVHVGAEPWPVADRISSGVIKALSGITLGSLRSIVATSQPTHDKATVTLQWTLAGLGTPDQSCPINESLRRSCVIRHVPVDV